jgi:RepB DNA-primase from phage plasmid
MRKPQLVSEPLTLNERVDRAAEHLVWVSSRQAHGKFVIRAFAPESGSRSLRLVSTEYFDNRDTHFEHKLRRHLRHCLKKPWHTFYGINSFEIADAKASNVRESRLAQVDADSVDLPARGPNPTRIIKTSAGNHQFLYELDSALDSEEIEAVSSYLTDLVGGDRGGHSSAKLFRVPGSLNVKPAYTPAPLVEVVESRGPIHSAREMLEMARASEPSGRRLSMKRRTLRAANLNPAIVREKYYSRLSQDVRLRLRQVRPYESFTFRVAGREYVAPKDDRSAIV